MKPREISTLEWAARAAKWNASDWKKLVGGSLADSAAAFLALEQTRPEGLGLKPAESHWAWRFAAMTPAWRAVGASLDATRLSELLRGNLAYDDSGIDLDYEDERRALRILCVLRVFRNCTLLMGQPDPRINSLQRIELRGWREFPLAAFPGLAPSAPLREALGELGLGWMFKSLGTKELAHRERLASAWAVIMSAAAATAFAIWAACTHEILVAMGLIAASALSAGAMPTLCQAARRRVSRCAAEQILLRLGARPEVEGIPGGREALACLARVGGLGPLWEQGAQSGKLGWAELEPEQRREINSRRSVAAKMSLSHVARRLAFAEQDDLTHILTHGVELGLDKPPLNVRSTRL